MIFSLKTLLWGKQFLSSFQERNSNNELDLQQGRFRFNITKFPPLTDSEVPQIAEEAHIEGVNEQTEHIIDKNHTCLILNQAMGWSKHHVMFLFSFFFYHFMNLFSSNFQLEFSFWGLFRFLFPHLVPQTCMSNSTPSLQILELVAYCYIV